MKRLKDRFLCNCGHTPEFRKSKKSIQFKTLGKFLNHLHQNHSNDEILRTKDNLETYGTLRFKIKLELSK
jgi:hypothetical protein